MSSTEHSTVAACRFESGQVSVSMDSRWQRRHPDGATGASSTAPSTSPHQLDYQAAIWSAPESASIRISPMSRLGGKKNKNKKGPPRWSSTLHFHPDLQLPDTTTRTTAASNTNESVTTSTLVCLWQAKARECVTVALSSRPGFVVRGTFEVTFGDLGNTHTTILLTSRQPHKNDNKVSVLSHVCHENMWTSYWVCLVSTTTTTQAPQSLRTTTTSNKLYAGVGSIPGKQCIAILQVDDNKNNGHFQEEEDEEREGPEPDSTEQGRAGEGPPETADAQALPALNQEETRQQDDPAQKETARHKSNNKGPPPPPIIRCVGFGNSAIYDRQAPAPLFVRNICLTKATNELLATLDQLSPDTLETIVLGLDSTTGEDNESSAADAAVRSTMMSDETKALLFQEYQQECRKNKARAQKFGVPYVEPTPESFMAWSQVRQLRANPKAGFVTGLDLQDPAEMAKQEARRKRFGQVAAPTTTSGGEHGPEQTADMKGVESTATAIAASEGIPVEQAWDNEELVKAQRTDPPPSLWKIASSETGIPSSGSSNEFDTAEPPTLVPEKIHIFSIDWAAFKQIRTNDIMSYFSIYGPSYVEWLGDLSCNVLFEDQYSAARAMQHLSQEIVSPVPEKIISTRKEGVDPPTDFGRLGWRLGKTLLRKVSNDRYGRRGTAARLLMRVATSLDILHERPTSWPKPPPGFSTKRVLGPGSDFGKGASAGKKNKRKRGSDDDANRTLSSQPYDAGVALGSALSAGRAGFSVAEMEAERAKKKAKKQEEQVRQILDSQC